MMGTVDGGVLERIAKIMSYMRPALVGKSGKRLKRKDKLRMLASGSEAPLNGHLHGTLKPVAHQSAVVRRCRFFAHDADLCPRPHLRPCNSQTSMDLSCIAAPGCPNASLMRT